MAGYTIPTDNGLGGTTPSRLKLNTHQNPIKKADPYPGLDEATKLKITQEVNANYTSDVDRNIAANKLYKQYLTEATNKQLMADRQQARLELTAGSITAKNPIEKQKLSTIGTMSDMANVIRDAYMKDGVDLTQKSDQDILTKFATNNPELSAGMEDIINNNGDAIEWAKSVGLKERTGWDKVKDLVGSVAETIRKGGEGLESLIDKANNFLGADNERQSASFRNYMESKYSYADMWNMSKEQKDAEYQYYLDHKKELERSTAQDILDFAVGATDLAFWETAPLLTAGFTLAGNAEQLTENTMLEGVGEKVTGATEWLGEKTSVLGELAGYLPGLSQFKNSLDEQGQQEFDAYVGNLATMLVLHYGPKMARNGYNKFVNKPKKLSITSEGAKINPEGPTGPTGPKGPTEGGPTDIATENIKSSVVSELKPNEQAIIDAFKKFKETGAGADTIADKVLLFGKDAKGSIESAIKPALRVTKGAKENARVTERLDTMTRDLVKKGYKWETITEYKNAVMTEMGKMWGKVEGAVKDNAGLSISTEQLVNTCREYAAELRKTGKMDAVKAAEKMEQQASIWEEMGEISMDALEKLKQDNNSDANYRNSESSHYDDNLMKKINKNVGKMQEEILAKAESNTTLTPEEFSELKRMRGTYADLLGDINKAEIRQMRKTTSLGDQLNTVQSFGDAIGSSNNMIGAVWNGVKRVGKKVVNDAYERTRDADFLSRRAWEKYNEEINGKQEAKNGEKPLNEKVEDSQQQDGTTSKDPKQQIEEKYANLYDEWENAGADNYYKYQTAEGESYGVANPNEKTIAAEEGLNMKDFKNGRTVKERLVELGIQDKIANDLVDGVAYGKYDNGILELAPQIKEGTAPHELLHGAFDLVDEARKDSILQGIQERTGLNRVKAEEWLADNFSEYYRTGKFDTKFFGTGFVGTVKKFFNQVKEFLDGTYANRKEIKKLFDDILDGNDLGGTAEGKARFQQIQDLDKLYKEAVEKGDKETYERLLKEEAERNGYMERNNEYKMSHRAPKAHIDKEDFRNLDLIEKEMYDNAIDANLYAVANGLSPQPMDMLTRENARRYYRDAEHIESFNAIRDAMDSIQSQMKEYGEVRDMPKVKVYRAVPDYKKVIKQYENDLAQYKVRFDWETEPSFHLGNLSKDAREAFETFSDMYDKGYLKEHPNERLVEYLKDKIKEYSDNSIKEGMLQSGGDWVTPSRKYADLHGKSNLEGNYKVISEEVPADQLRWDGNDMNEWGFDDGNKTAIKGDTKNSRKTLEPTYDDKGNLIPLSKRFNEAKKDARYQRTEGTINDLNKDYYNIIRPDYEIKDWNDPNLHGALDYLIKKQGIKVYGNGVGAKIKAINSYLPKIRNGDDIYGLSQIDQFGYDVKDKIIEHYLELHPGVTIRDRDNWSSGNGSYQYNTSVKVKIGNYEFEPHMSSFLYEKLKDQGIIR